ncbi:molecular chaperone GrpE [Micromonospora sp. Llam0]|uniref:nucleotide exchange factor GrpE n=1 Tax=Micromonospora sp. Llam0 TaxID=2485143 RepID=UPI000FB0D4D4|nr:nucleotide exchange factor GrpE [Micromonospora sp. Llam0]ROO52363.1 molecular chaperone GrpE [Micromonospora sp. Llam0]
MTEKSRAADPAGTGPPRRRSAPVGQADGETTDRLVIRDKRRIDPTGTRPRTARHAAAEPTGAAPPTDHRPTGRHARSGTEEEPVSGKADDRSADGSAASDTENDESTRSATVGGAATGAATGTGSATDSGSATGSGSGTDRAVQPDSSDTAVVDEPVVGEPVTGEVVEQVPESDAEAAAGGAAGSGPLGAELEALRSDLDERTRDLQRVTAEYANYRKRVERDKGVAADQATGAVLAALLPILDDLDRAREHGDLVGPFGAVAEQLGAALGKFGLTAFGEKGDPFDPTQHEAVAHLTSAEVTEPTCVDVMRRGYLLGDRLLRAALVAVADPE